MTYFSTILDFELSDIIKIASYARSYSPHARKSPRRRSVSPRRGRSYSRSPPYRRARNDSPFANGYVMGPCTEFLAYVAIVIYPLIT